MRIDNLLHAIPLIGGQVEPFEHHRSENAHRAASVRRDRHVRHAHGPPGPPKRPPGRLVRRRVLCAICWPAAKPTPASATAMAAAPMPSTMRLLIPLMLSS